MFRSLRVRLALSHTVPVLLFVALLGTLLIYQLERTYFLDSLATELAGQGAIIASFTREEVQVWSNPKLAKFLVDQLQSRVNAQIMFIGADGRVVAASWFDGNAEAGQRVTSEVVDAALHGKSTWSINNSVILQGQVIDVAVPVVRNGGKPLGVIRLSHSLEEIKRRLAPLHGIVWLMLGVGATLSLLLGLALAQSVSAPLQRLAGAVGRFRPTEPFDKVPEEGPTEIRTVAAAFNQMGARLVELESSRRALLTGIVHELSRPLGAIKAAAQTIAKNPEPDLSVELATGIDDQVEQMRFQVEDLALLSALEYRGVQMKFDLIDIGELVEQQCQRAEINAQDRGTELSWVVSPFLPLIKGDAKRITMILDNLIHNALKYTPSGGAVHVEAYPVMEENGEAGKQTTKDSGDGTNQVRMGEVAPLSVSTTTEAHNASPNNFVEISVTDNGPGIALEEQDRIFQLFYRSPAQQRRHQGMGIGLALARQLAERHGGELTVRSNESEGATFTLRLPVEPPLSPETDADA